MHLKKKQFCFKLKIFLILDKSKTKTYALLRTLKGIMIIKILISFFITISITKFKNGFDVL